MRMYLRPMPCLILNSLPWLPTPIVRECSRRRVPKRRMYLHQMPCLTLNSLPWLPKSIVRECSGHCHSKMRMYLSGRPSESLLSFPLSPFPKPPHSKPFPRAMEEELETSASRGLP